MNVFSNHPSRQKAKAKTERKFWISPLNIERSLLGAYNSTFLLARRNVPEQFDHLLSLIRPNIEKEHKVCSPILAEERLAGPLRYLASGDSKQSISYQYKMGKSTINGIVDEVCDAIWESPADFVKTPTTPRN